MAQFLKEFPPIDIELQKQIYDFIRADKTEMSKSMLYSSSTETKFTDEEKRLSTYKSIVNDTLFSLVEKLVVELSNKDPDNNYMLVRNDVTCIKYEPGGFFKLHEDYLGLTFNIIQEYTMIICMDSTSTTYGTMIEKVLTKDGHVDLTGKYRTVKKFNESDTTNTYWSLDDNNILFVNKDIRTRIKKLIKMVFIMILGIVFRNHGSLFHNRKKIFLKNFVTKAYTVTLKYYMLMGL